MNQVELHKQINVAMNAFVLRLETQFPQSLKYRDLKYPSKNRKQHALFSNLEIKTLAEIKVNTMYM